MKALFFKYKDFIMEVIHFGLVGVINTLMGWVIMAVLYNLVHMNYCCPAVFLILSAVSFLTMPTAE